MNLRPSSIARVIACPPSLVPPAVLIDTPSEVRSEGSAVHEWMSKRIKGADVDANAIALKWGVDANEFGKLTRLALARWLSVADHFAGCETEHAFRPLTWEHASGETLTLAGTCDVIAVDDGATVKILDHKTGWGDGDHQSQMRAYGVLALAEYEECNRVFACVLGVRQGTLDTYEWTRGELFEWFADAVDTIFAKRDIYGHSPNTCRFCPRRHECPARQTMVRDAVAMVTIMDADAPLTLTPEQIGDLYLRAKLVEDAAGQVLDLIRSAVFDAGGVLDAGENQIVLEQTQKREIDVAAGEAVLTQFLGDGWRSAIQVSNKAIEAVAKDAAPSRGKAKLMRELWQALEEADAVRVTTTQRMMMRRKTLEIVANEGGGE
jgi:hypothetical protein